MDDDGYPTEEELEKVTNWDWKDYKGLMDYVKSLWHWNGYGFNEMEKHYEIHTYGWSGNEELILAMKKNQMFWLLYWEQSRRGGHYIFSETTMSKL